MSPPERTLTGSSLPPRLRELDGVPSELYLRGELPRGPAVAIVGTRAPTEAARAYAAELAGELACAGASVWSGGAAGIDTAAHEGALAAGGTTVVVAPAGFEHPFPEDNAALFARVVDSGGAYLSLTRDAARQDRFFPRNRVLVALAHVVVVVEAPCVSGARNAAKWARRLGLPLFVCASPPWNPRGRGCIVELGLGARALFSYRDVLETLGELRAHPVRVSAELPLFSASAERPAPEEHPDSPADRVLEAVRAGACHVDAICSRTGLPVARVQQLVLTLTLDGVLVPDLSGRLSVASGRIH
jgi:DNA processing protein